MRNYEYLMDKTVARETPVVYPPGTARAARACKGHVLWWQIVQFTLPSFHNRLLLNRGCGCKCGTDTPCFVRSCAQGEEVEDWQQQAQRRSAWRRC